MKKVIGICFLLPLVYLLFLQQVFAAKIDTVVTHSKAMKKDIKTVVITPEQYSVDMTYPVIYLLHGYGGDYSNWIKNVPGLLVLADQHNLIIVCPDGNLGSWYFDSPVDGSYRYETYITNELISYIDSHYSTIKSNKGRAITGLSMGGHGALYLAFKHQDVFGAAGSMSGGVDFRPFPGNWQIAQRLGPYAQNHDLWDKNTVINLVHLLMPNKLALIIDCGTEDFFYKVNVNLHDKLSYSNIPHDFIVRPGSHNWAYWENAVIYQIQFMSLHFKRVSGK